MKKGNFLASLYAVFIGLFTIAFAIVFGGNAWSSAILVLIYFVGATLIFIKVAGEHEVEKLASGEIVAIYGLRFWLPMTVGAIASIMLGFLFYKNSSVTEFAGIHFGLGAMSVLTAFVSPRFKHGEATRNRFPENDILD